MLFCYSYLVTVGLRYNKLEFAAEGVNKFLIDVEAPAIAFPRPF